MICFPNAKINLGLHVLSKRPDGFHEIQTVFYPVSLCDMLEVIPATDGRFRLKISGDEPDCDAEHNLCTRAFRLMEREFAIGQVHMYLHKRIPSGAGLGGGSSDAAFALKMLSRMFQLGLSDAHLAELALQLGSDCAFFVANKPVFAQGRGELFEPIAISLSGKHVVITKPGFSVNTAEAYSLVTPGKRSGLQSAVSAPITTWKENVRNDFEQAVFSKYPQLKDMRDKLYDSGAVYAAMSGSGSAVFGIFDVAPSGSQQWFPGCFVWEGIL